MRCDCCGKEVERRDTYPDYCFCDDCEEAYQRDLAREYPYGQCQQCGAVAKLCRDGRVRTFHAEGECSNWRDYADMSDEEYAQTGYIPS